MLTTLLISLAGGAVLVPMLLRGMRAAGQVRENFRGRAVVFPGGLAAVLAAVAVVGALGAVQGLTGGAVMPTGDSGWTAYAPLVGPVHEGRRPGGTEPGRVDDVLVLDDPRWAFPVLDLEEHAHAMTPAFGLVIAFAFGVALLGLVDDLLAGAPRGIRGHLRALRGGTLSTGVTKAVGTLALAFATLAALGMRGGDLLLAVAVVTVTTNVGNLLDLRPGRAIKAFVVLGVGLTVSTGVIEPVPLLAPVLGPLLVLGLFDLRERAMLGDTGSNLLGALAGLWLVMTLGTLGQLVALAVALGVTAYGEIRSISSTVERVAPLRWLDRLGRPG